MVDENISDFSDEGLIEEHEMWHENIFGYWQCYSVQDIEYYEALVDEAYERGIVSDLVENARVTVPEEI